MLQKSDASAELPDDVVTAQRRVRRAVCTLPPPAALHVLTEQLAQEIVASGMAESPMYEDFMRMQVGALMQRVRGVCDELGVEIPEAPVPAPKTAWWRRLVPAT